MNTTAIAITALICLTLIAIALLNRDKGGRHGKD